MNIYYLECPHCNGLIEIYEVEINCAIFRHGIFKDSGNQLNPHASKEECESAFTNALIIGCGKPFRLVKSIENNQIFLEKCDYI